MKTTILVPLLMFIAQVSALEVREGDLEEFYDLGEELTEGKRHIEEELEEVSKILRELRGELEEAEGRGHRRELEMEIQHLQAETETQRRLIPMYQRLLNQHKEAKIAMDGKDEGAIGRVFQQFHRAHDGFRLREELIYLAQDKKRFQTQLKFLGGGDGGKEESRKVTLGLEFAESNLVAQEKLLHLWEGLEAAWKSDPEADTEAREADFWVAQEKDELGREERRIVYQMELLNLEARELEELHDRLRRRKAGLEQQLDEHGEIVRLYRQLQAAREQVQELRVDELEENYHRRKEAFHLKADIREVSEELEELRREGEYGEARELSWLLRELEEELGTLR
jgi:hypothetical protein